MMKTVRIDMDSVEYPARLRDIPDPPKQLYCTGNTDLLSERSIGVVGARKNTVYGKNVALMIGRRLAESGLVVTSGLALGIDGYSHEGALEADGRVIGVLGSGIDHMTPQRISTGRGRLQGELSCEKQNNKRTVGSARGSRGGPGQRLSHNCKTRK